MATKTHMEDQFEHYKEMIPSDDCMPLFGLRILAYYNAQGVLSFQMMSDREVPVPLSTTLGIIELAKHELMLVNTFKSMKPPLNFREPKFTSEL